MKNDVNFYIYLHDDPVEVLVKLPIVAGLWNKKRFEANFSFQYYWEKQKYIFKKPANLNIIYCVCNNCHML